MEPTDFGVNVDALPKLVLNEEAGRKLLGKLNAIEAFRDHIDMGKRVFFLHYLDRHLEIDAAGADTSSTKAFLRLTDKLMRDHEPVWASISRMMDRHIFLQVTAYASMRENVLDDDDLEYLKCNAYSNSYHEIVAGAISGWETADVLAYRITHRPSITLEASMRAKSTIDKDATRYKKVAAGVLLGVIEDLKNRGSTD